MNVNLISYINSTGYGYAGVNLAANLALAGHNVSLFPIDHMVEVPAKYAAIIDEARQNAGSYDYDAPSVRICHQNMLAEHVGRGNHYGFPFFELDRLTAGEQRHIHGLDGVMVASKWASHVVNEYGVADISVVPLGVDRTVFHEDIPATRLDDDFTVFVNVGKWEIRKGHDVLLNAFCKAFSRTDKVVLKLLPYNMFIGPGNEAWAKMYMSSSMASRIQIHPHRVREQGEVARFIASGDCAVFPARAEAWNHELLESMSCGLTCIATDYSGHTEYATEGNCRLITVEGMEPAIDHVWFHGQGYWAEIGRHEEEQLIEHMRSVHRLKQTGELVPNKEGVATATHLSWERSATKLAESIT